jgi:hypothetical protein
MDTTKSPQLQQNQPLTTSARLNNLFSIGLKNDNLTVSKSTVREEKVPIEVVEPPPPMVNSVPEVAQVVQVAREPVKEPIEAQEAPPEREAPIEAPKPKPKGGKRPNAGRKAAGTGGNIATVPEVTGQQQGAEVVVHTPSFPVITGLETIEEAIDANSAALMDDAFQRASKAGTSGDAFDKMVYLKLLENVIPKAKRKGKEPITSQTAKETLKALDRIIANGGVSDAVYTEPTQGADVQDAEVVGEAE